MISICFIGDRNIYIKRICNYLAGENYHIHLICRHDQGIKAEEFDNRITIYTLRSNRLVKKMMAINSYLKKNKPDFVHFQYLQKKKVPEKAWQFFTCDKAAAGNVGDQAHC